MTKKGAKRASGSLIIIGGGEERTGKMKILSEVAKAVGERKLCIATVASRIGHELWEIYHELFRMLGVKKISHLDVVQRQSPVDERALKAVEDAEAVFFTGGDQLKITSELGGTVIADRIRAIYRNGGVIAGTSAGASVMSETMLVSGRGEAYYRIGQGPVTAPGLGLVKNMIIDQHFAERGRIGRLLAAVAQNPRYLGIGIDENTAIVMESKNMMQVIGAGAVHVIDSHESTETNISEENIGRTLSIFNVKFHLLSDGDGFDFRTREPISSTNHSKHGNGYGKVRPLHA